MTEYMYGRHSGERYQVIARYGTKVWAVRDGWAAPDTLTYGVQLTDKPPQPDPAEGQKWQYKGTHDHANTATVVEVTDRHVVYGYDGRDFMGLRALTREDFLAKFTYAGAW